MTHGAAPGWRTLLLVALAAVGCAVPIARADDDVAALRGQIEQIKSLVSAFEARLAALEAARAAQAIPSRSVAPAVNPQSPSVVPAPAPVPVTGAAGEPGAVPRSGWRQIREGLTTREVTALIGAPLNTFELAGKTVWYYRYSDAGPGSVFFNGTGTVSSLQRPTGSIW